MFATDKNIESIAELVEALKKYGTLKLEHARLGFIEKTVRLISMLILFLIVMLSIVLMMIFLSVAAALAIGHATDSMITGFLVVTLCHFSLLTLIFVFRKTLIQKPLVKLLVSILLS